MRMRHGKVVPEIKSQKQAPFLVPPFSDDDQNTTLLPLLAQRHHPGILLSSTATRCQHPELLDNHIPGLIWDGCSSSVSSSQSPTSNWKQGRGQDSHGWHHKKHLRDRIRTRGLMRPPSVGTRTLEFFMDRPPEPTFSQERNNLHAMEVTDDKIAVVNTISMASHCPLVGCGPMIPFHLDSGTGLCLEKG